MVSRIVIAIRRRSLVFIAIVFNDLIYPNDKNRLTVLQNTNHFNAFRAQAVLFLLTFKYSLCRMLMKLEDNCSIRAAKLMM